MTGCCGSSHCPSVKKAIEGDLAAPLYCPEVQKSILSNVRPFVAIILTLGTMITYKSYDYFFTQTNLNSYDENSSGDFEIVNKFVIKPLYKFFYKPLIICSVLYVAYQEGLFDIFRKPYYGVKVMSDLFNAQNQDDVNHQRETHFHNGHKCHDLHHEVVDNFVQFYQNSNFISLEELRNSGFKQPETASKMIGIPGENNILVAHENGSAIFSRGTNNFIVASNKTDDFYFSLCSTKDVVIEEFDAKQDFIHFFCTKKIITKADINLSISANGTLITVTGDETSSSVFLSQVDDFSLSQIDYTNTKVQEINGIKALVELVASGETSNIIMEIN